MKKFLIASVAVISVLGLSACNDSGNKTDNATPPATTQPAPATPPANDTAPATPAQPGTTTPSQ